MPDSGAAAFRWFTGSRWPGRSGGGASRHCSWTRPGNWPATRASPRWPSPWACSTSTAQLSGRTDDDLII